MGERRFTHTDATGKMRMVDVSRKRPTRREALASCLVRTTATVESLRHAEGDVDSLHVSRLAGIQAAKHTADLIPLCHPLNLEQVLVDVTPAPEGFRVEARVVTVSRTGVEMEALTACAVAAVSLVSSLRTVDHDALVDEVVLERKSGGKSGEWGRQVDGRD
ncbi:MAG: cyclic pyranopterin monophosphate synthase MoaC [Acidobacteriota bacterium]|nr:cyclic pyranopterin monophosphate synthase MoaC [Acidobacteriota bacterium]